MPFVIIRTDGRPLAMHDGAVIVFESEDSARPWLQPGERIEEAPDGIEGAEPMQGETEHGDNR